MQKASRYHSIQPFTSLKNRVRGPTTSPKPHSQRAAEEWLESDSPDSLPSSPAGYAYSPGSLGVRGSCNVKNKTRGGGCLW